MHTKTYPWLPTNWWQYDQSISDDANILLHTKQERMENTHISTPTRKLLDNCGCFVIFMALLSTVLITFLQIEPSLPSFLTLEVIGLRFPHRGLHGHEKGAASFAPEDVQKLWGYMSPYYPLATYKSPPPDCTITQVNILHRHGARYPKTADYIATVSAVNKIQSARDFKDDNLNFLNNFTYDLGAERLVEYGAEQSWISGYFAYERYGHLIDDENMPFLRASLSDRVVDSARNWSAGFYQRSGSRYRPNLSVLIPEGEHDNNTLADNCPKAIGPFEQFEEWVDIYAAPIADRLNVMSIGLPENITALDAFYLMMMCPSETVYHKRYSDFCYLFSKTEFENFEYALDLEQYYSTGYGQVQDLGRAQGVGYVNELLARLTNSPVKDNTQTNHTLDDNPKTFPLDRKMYADFGHDHAMVAVYSAMGLFNYSKLDPSNPDPDREWVVSRIVPFSGRMSVERLQCKPKLSSWWMGHTKVWKRNGEYVRVLVNDATRPLAFCGGDEDGLCELGRFVESQEYARVDGQREFARCGYASQH